MDGNLLGILLVAATIASVCMVWFLARVAIAGIAKSHGLKIKPSFTSTPRNRRWLAILITSFAIIVVPVWVIAIGYYLENGFGGFYGDFYTTIFFDCMSLFAVFFVLPIVCWILAWDYRDYTIVDCKHINWDDEE